MNGVASYRQKINLKYYKTCVKDLKNPSKECSRSIKFRHIWSKVAIYRKNKTVKYNTKKNYN